MARGDFPSAKQDQFVLRFPDGMRDRIKRKAEQNGRSMNEEIVRTLELAFPEPVSIAERLEELKHLFSALSKVRGYSAALAVLQEEIVETLEAAAAGRDPDLDDAAIYRLRKSLKSWSRGREREEEEQRLVINEKYKSPREET